MLQLLIATRNSHKTAEFAQILGRDFAVADLTSLASAEEVEETGETFEENATLKALAASQMTQRLVVADDSGLEVDALGGAPGVYSARYAGASATDEQNIAKLLLELRRVGADSGVSARFQCVLVLARDGAKKAAFAGSIEGKIISSPRGQHGFGYDPIFVPAGYNSTFGELGEAAKNSISHRADAIRQLKDYLRRQMRGE